VQSTLNIPKSFSSYCLSNKIVEAKTYVFLKMQCSGKIRFSRAIIKKACKVLGISRGTFYRHVGLLKQRNWIGYNSQSQIYFIRSFKYVCNKENLEGRTCTVFSSKWFKSFKAFCSGSVIGYLVKHQRKAERKKGRSKQSRPVATSAIIKIMNIPESTAYQLKQIASKAGFIKKRRDFLDTGISSFQIKSFRKVYPEISHKAVSHKGTVQLCKPDLCTECLRYKTDKSL